MQRKRREKRKGEEKKKRRRGKKTENTISTSTKHSVCPTLGLDLAMDLFQMYAPWLQSHLGSGASELALLC